MKSDKLRIAVALLFLMGGLYVAYLTVLAPIHTINQSSSSQATYIAKHAPYVQNEDTLLIPKISVRAPIKEGGAESLQNGAIWHRQPQNGDPVQGGNFVLAGHRYQFAFTPNRTIKNSVLYDLDKMKLGDRIFVDWKKKRYTYTVTKLYSVKPNAVEIEKRSDQSKLTIYTCTLAGSTDGRVVVEAQPIHVSI